MSYYNLIIPRESAWLVMNELGELDCLHFVDYDITLPQINRPFANNIKRLDTVKFNYLGVMILWITSNSFLTKWRTSISPWSIVQTQRIWFSISIEILEEGISKNILLRTLFLETRLLIHTLRRSKQRLRRRHNLWTTRLGHFRP